MKRIIIFLIFGLMTSHIFCQDNTESSLSDAKKIVGLSKCWSEVKYNFVYFDQLNFDWDSLYQEFVPIILATKNDFEYFRELQRFTAALQDGHSGVYWPSELWDNWATIPVPTRLIDGKVIVVAELNDTLKKQGIETGTEVLKINGMDVHQYVSTYIKPYIPSSTEQWLNKQAYGRECTRGKKGEDISLTFRNKKGKVFESTINHSMSENMNNNSNKPLFSFSVVENNIGCLNVTSFMGNNYTRQFDSIFNLISNTDGLIIDIRGNGGGNSNNSAYILSHLTNKNFKMSDWSSPLYIPAHASWNYPKEWYMMKSGTYGPVKNKSFYEKPVVLLIDEATFSAAEDFCVGFRTMKRGLIIGAPSGGSTGNPIAIELPGNGWLQVCTKKDTYPDGTKFVGVGILPDIEVNETVESFLSKVGPDTDRSLTKMKAIEVIKTKIKKQSK